MCGDLREGIEEVYNQQSIVKPHYMELYTHSLLSSSTLHSKYIP